MGTYDENRMSDLIDGGLHLKEQLEKEAEQLILEDAKKSGWEEIERLRWSTIEVIAFMVQFKINKKHYDSADELCSDCGLSKDENGWCDCWQGN